MSTLLLLQVSSTTPSSLFLSAHKLTPTTTLHAAATTTSSSSTPSMSDQLLPLSQTMLKTPSKPTKSPLPAPSKPTWVNPSKPKPTILTLRRHLRSSPSSPPSLSTTLSPLLRKLHSLPSTPHPSNSANFYSLLDSAFSIHSPISHDDALLLINSLSRSWHKCLYLLSWLRSRRFFPVDTVFYNVALKSLRSAYKWDDVEKLAKEMVAADVEMDNVTYSTIITAARRVERYDKAIEWFERMYCSESRILPDEVTYSAVLDVYARLGKREEVMTLFERARAGGWTPDAVAFAVLARMFGEDGDYDGIQFVLHEMRVAAVKPNRVVYNTLLFALGKARKPAIARNLFNEMISSGVSPNAKTLTALVKIYGRARWGRDAMELWGRIRENKWPVDFILHNTLLSICADLGMEAEAAELFGEMKKEAKGGRMRALDDRTYAAIINVYCRGGKADCALALFEEMIKGGIEPSIMSYTSLIRCLGKSGRIPDAVNVFDVGIERGLKPDDRFCGCLLSVVALSKGEVEIEMVLGCLDKANSRLVKLIRMLGDDGVGVDSIKEEFRGILNAVDANVRQPYCNCLIDICWNHGFPSRRSSELLHLGVLYGLYPGLHEKKPYEWSLHLQSLSVGAANTAFEVWIKSLSKSLEEKEELPPSFFVQTGAGTQKISLGLTGVFDLHLKKLAAPFEAQNGGFVASKDDLISWLQLGSFAALTG